MIRNVLTGDHNILESYTYTDGEFQTVKFQINLKSLNDTQQSIHTNGIYGQKVSEWQRKSSNGFNHNFSIQQLKKKHTLFPCPYSDLLLKNV